MCMLLIAALRSAEICLFDVRCGRRREKLRPPRVSPAKALPAKALPAKGVAIRTCHLSSQSSNGGRSRRSPSQPSRSQPLACEALSAVTLPVQPLPASANTGAGVIQPAPRRVVGPARNREARRGGNALTRTNHEMPRFGMMHPCGVGRSTERDQKAQDQNRTHRGAPLRLSCTHERLQPQPPAASPGRRSAESYQHARPHPPPFERSRCRMLARLLR